MLPTETGDLFVALQMFIQGLLGTARDQSAINIYMAQVIAFYPPRVLAGADGFGVYPWPASVDVSVVPLYTRDVENLAQARPTEVPLGQVRGGVRLQGPENIVSGVPVLYVGTSELTMTEPLLPGQRGLLLLSGKHHSTVISDGIPVASHLVPSVERLSDSFFLPGFVIGVEAATLPPSCAPLTGMPAQLGPRTPEAEVVHLRRQPGGWILGGTDIRLGGVTAGLGGARLGDTCTLDPSVVAFMAAVSTALGTLGFPTPPPTSPTATITTASTVVKLL
jgi:hypothetical protein